MKIEGELVMKRDHVKNGSPLSRCRHYPMARHGMVLNVLPLMTAYLTRYSVHDRESLKTFFTRIEYRS